MQGRLYGQSIEHAGRRADELLGQLDLAGAGARVVATLSGGQRRRLDIAMGLMHLPRLLFLDEPSTGLDPQSRANLWEHIRALHAEHGTTLFLTTHYLDEADALCDRILVIDRGRIVAEGTPDELKRRVSGDLVVVGADSPQIVAKLVGELPGSTEPNVDGSTVRFRAADGTAALPLLLLSGVLLPMSVAPAWLFGLSRANPFVYIVDAERAMFQGELISPTVMAGVGVSAALALVCGAWGIRTFQRESA